MRTAWDERYSERGEALAVVLCQFHDPLLFARPLDRWPEGKHQEIRLVPRMDGSVSRVTVPERQQSNGTMSIAWADF